MRIYHDERGIVGVCPICWGHIYFQRKEDEDDYYETEDIVNKWMDHQLNDCNPQIDTEIYKP